MKLSRTFRLHPALFGVVPLVNVVFLVVVFFALSSHFVLQPGLAVSLPASAFTITPHEGAQIVSITSAPVPAIYHGDQPVTLAELRARLAKNSAKERFVIIKADKTTPYELVVQITNEALQLGLSVVLATSADRP